MTNWQRKQREESPRGQGLGDVQSAAQNPLQTAVPRVGSMSHMAVQGLARRPAHESDRGGGSLKCSHRIRIPSHTCPCYHM